MQRMPRPGVSVGTDHASSIHMADQKDKDDIDYTAEGNTPLREKHDPTDEGYDEAAHSGPERFGIPEGEGGVFGTTGGGTYDGGLHIEKKSEK